MDIKNTKLLWFLNVKQRPQGRGDLAVCGTVRKGKTGQKPSHLTYLISCLCSLQPLSYFNAEATRPQLFFRKHFLKQPSSQGLINPLPASLPSRAFQGAQPDPLSFWFLSWHQVSLNSRTKAFIFVLVCQGLPLLKGFSKISLSFSLLLNLFLSPAQWPPLTFSPTEETGGFCSVSLSSLFTKLNRVKRPAQRDHLAGRRCWLAGTLPVASCDTVPRQLC